MKSFLKFIGAVVSVFTVVLGVLSIYDRFFKKDYYVCDQTDDEV